ncbi:MAG: hypothetical protein IPM92_17130 [Saprospiraceae bacterium]|nr:hypothetical protein [Saprospiraceae bacterium]
MAPGIWWSYALSISDLELNTCMVLQDTVTLVPTNLAPSNYKFYMDSVAKSYHWCESFQ